MLHSFVVSVMIHQIAETELTGSFTLVVDVEAEGAVIEAEGSVIEAEGAVIEAEGAVIEAEGAVVEAEGAVVDAERGEGAVTGTDN